jgi:hypothetical protein
MNDRRYAVGPSTDESSEAAESEVKVMGHQKLAYRFKLLVLLLAERVDEAVEAGEHLLDGVRAEGAAAQGGEHGDRCQTAAG